MTFRPRLGLVLAVAALTACSPHPPPADPSSPRARAAALAERAEGDAAAGRMRDALDEYREAARLAPAEERYTRRAAELKAALATARHGEAVSALKRGDLATARREALALVESEPDSPAGYDALASVAESEGQLEDAWTAREKAHALAPSDAALAETLAVLAMKTSRFAEAEALYKGLAKDDPAMEERRAAARLEFQVENLPAAARSGAVATRVTRAQLAALLVALVPEVAAARVPPGADVATDAVGRPETSALVKAIALGFLSVSKETHLVGADAPVLRSEMPGHLRRLAGLLNRRDDACFATLAALSTCGILPETTSRHVGGRETFAAIEATLRLAR